MNITALREGIFFADLIFSNGVEVSARPSDSIALALRTGATIFASEDVLEEAGVAIPDEQEDEVGSSANSSTRSPQRTSAAPDRPPLGTGVVAASCSPISRALCPQGDDPWNPRCRGSAPAPPVAEAAV